MFFRILCIKNIPYIIPNFNTPPTMNRFLTLLLLFLCSSTLLWAQQGDECVDAILLSGFPNSENEAVFLGPYNNEPMTTIPSDPVPDCFREFSVAKSMWFFFIGDGNSYEIRTSSACLPDLNTYIDNGDTQMAIFTGNCNNNLNLTHCNDDFPLATANDLFAGIRLNTQVGVNYRMMIDGYNVQGQVATGDFCFRIEQIPPVCAAQVDLDPDLPLVVELCPSASLNITIDPSTFDYGFDLADDPNAGMAWFIFDTNPLDNNPSEQPPQNQLQIITDSPFNPLTINGEMDGLFDGHSTIWVSGILSSIDPSTGELIIPICTDFTASIQIDFLTDDVLGCNTTTGESCLFPFELPDLPTQIGEQEIYGPYDNTNFTSYRFNPLPNCFTDNRLDRVQWFAFTGDGNRYTIRTSNICGNGLNLNDDGSYINSGDTQMAIFAGNCGDEALTEIACNEDAITASTTHRFSEITIPTEAGVVYYLMIDGRWSAMGSFCLQLEQVDPCTPKVELAPDTPSVIELCPEQAAAININTNTFDLGGSNANGVVWMLLNIDPMGANPNDLPPSNNLGYFIGHPFSGDFIVSGNGTGGSIWVVGVLAIIDPNTGTAIFDDCIDFTTAVQIIHLPDNHQDCLAPVSCPEEPLSQLELEAHLSSPICTDQSVLLTITDSSIPVATTQNEEAAIGWLVMTTNPVNGQNALALAYDADPSFLGIALENDFNFLYQSNNSTFWVVGVYFADIAQLGDSRFINCHTFTEVIEVTFVDEAESCPPALLGDLCSDPIVIETLPATQGNTLFYGPYDNSEFTVSIDDPLPSCFAEGTLENTMWFTFTGDGGIYHIRTSDECAGDLLLSDFDLYITDGDTQMAGYTGDCANNLTQIVCNEDATDAPSGDFFSEIRIETEVGTTYYIMVDGYQADGTPSIGSFCLAITPGEPCTTNVDLAMNTPLTFEICSNDTAIFNIDTNTLDFGGTDANGIVWNILGLDPMGVNPNNIASEFDFGLFLGHPFAGDYDVVGDGSGDTIWVVGIMGNIDLNAGRVNFDDCIDFTPAIRIINLADGQEDCPPPLDCSNSNIDLAPNTPTTIFGCPDVTDSVTVFIDETTLAYGDDEGPGASPAWLIFTANPGTGQNALDLAIANDPSFLGINAGTSTTLFHQGVTEHFWIVATNFPDEESGIFITSGCLDFTDVVEIVFVEETLDCPPTGNFCISTANVDITPPDPLFFCLGLSTPADVIPTDLPTPTETQSTDFTFIITSQNNVDDNGNPSVVELTEDGSFDFNPVGMGTYCVYGMAYNEADISEIAEFINENPSLAPVFNIPSDSLPFPSNLSLASLLNTIQTVNNNFNIPQIENILNIFNALIATPCFDISDVPLYCIDVTNDITACVGEPNCIQAAIFEAPNCAGTMPNTYSFNFIIAGGSGNHEITPNAGTLTNLGNNIYSLSNIPENQNVMVTVSDEETNQLGCEPFVLTVDAPNCNCDFSLEQTEMSDGDAGGVTPFHYNNTHIDLFGGTPPFTYQWDRTGYVRSQITPPDQIQVVYSESATWSVTITDANACTAIATNDQNSNEDGNIGGTLRIYNHTIIPNNCQSSIQEGRIILAVEGGIPPYRYAWSGPNNWLNAPTGAVIDLNEVDELPQGWYSVVVTDSHPMTPNQTSGWYWVSCQNNPANGGGFIRGKQAPSGQVAHLTAFPNPFSTETAIQFSIPQTQNVQLQLFSVTGQLVQTIKNGVVQANQLYSITIEGSDLPTGVYVLQLTLATGEKRYYKLMR